MLGKVTLSRWGQVAEVLVGTTVTPGWGVVRCLFC